MRHHLPWLLFTILLCFGTCSLSAQEDLPAPGQMSPPSPPESDPNPPPPPPPMALPSLPPTVQMNLPMGMLGMPLGTFAVIEGTEHETGLFEGHSDFEIEKINKKKLGETRRIKTSWSADFPDKRVPGKKYVLHGFETGAWNGIPVSLRAPDTAGGFFFDRIFVVTSVEKIDGVATHDAKPVDPDFVLAEPNLTAKPDKSAPVGALGRPVGTPVMIEVHTPTPNPAMEQNAFQVDNINGRPPATALYISIPGFHEIPDGKHLRLYGFESGAWGGLPAMPESEEASKGAEVQQPFHLVTKFIVADR